MSNIDDSYSKVRSGGAGFYTGPRGLIEVWGKEAVQFLDGLISNNVKALEAGGQMLAAFPNAQGRLVAVVRVQRRGDRFLFETEDATREKVFQNLFRFTFAGDFLVEDLSDRFQYFEIFGETQPGPSADALSFDSAPGRAIFVPVSAADEFRTELADAGSAEITEAAYEVLRIENGIPLYGVDMDETTIAPELGLDGLISYNKGCYIGQEIIARIHFRGHVAKRLTGLVAKDSIEVGLLSPGLELTSNGKKAGKITSSAYSPALDKLIALAYVRYEFLADGTPLNAGANEVTVKDLPLL
ncbi:MAG TPA: glycine cleavage T C-terminal barrel domain-containing protein [Pyrinomonadaceae bacterium]|nr:glycine cleavage T C-terminal barrel domain-containing protein [Pyrinomonadaceae bacterium]